MAISVFPTPSAEPKPVGATDKVISGYVGDGDYTHPTTLASGKYAITASVPVTGGRNDYFISGATNPLQSGNSGGITTYVKLDSSETSLNISSNYGVLNQYQFTTGNTYRVDKIASNQTNTEYVMFTLSSSGDVYTCSRSTDGVNFTKTNHPSNANTAYLFRGDGIYIAGTNLSTIYRSTDGITWSSASGGGSTGLAYGYLYANSTGVKYIIGNNAPQISTSTNGITWTGRSNPVTGTPNSFAYGNNTYLAMGTSNTTGLNTSTDGITWGTAYAVPSGTSAVEVTFFNGKFLLFSADNTQWESTTGLSGSWTKVTSFPGDVINPSSGSLIMKILNNTLTACQEGNKNYYYTSTDGTTWKKVFTQSILNKASNGAFLATITTLSYNSTYGIIGYGSDYLPGTTSSQQKAAAFVRQPYYLSIYNLESTEI
jgi:hypothetical protein